MTSRSRRPSTSTRSHDGGVPLSFHFNGSVLYRGESDRLQVVLVPWSCSIQWRMPVDVWRRAIDAHYPGGGWIRLHHDTLQALAQPQGRARDALVRRDRAGAPGGVAVSVETMLSDAALRGLRALPVHAGGDQERDADPVRDRLSAGLRGRRPAHVRPRADAGRARAVRSGRPDLGHGRVPRAQRRAPPGRRAPRRARADRAGLRCWPRAA